MDKTLGIVFYIYTNYSDKYKLSESRLLGMLYLADWKYAIQHGERMTNIEWQIYNDGPHPDSQALSAILDYFVQLKLDFSNISSQKKVSLSVDEKNVIDFVIKTSDSLDLDNFTRLIYSTYPVIAERKTEKTNLVESAKKYKQIKPLLSKD